jgi:hypothetical protein
MTNPGIDYGMGTTNVDHVTGIRYGVISQHDVLQAWADSSEPQYGEPTCPKCGGDVVDSCCVNNDGDRWPRLYSNGCEDYACESCEVYLDSSDVYGEEPIGFTFEDDGYLCENCLDSDIIILKSPFYTFAPFCSPCVPGAGNLNDADGPRSGGVKTYCFGHDWFEDCKEPYPVYRVDTDAEVTG